MLTRASPRYSQIQIDEKVIRNLEKLVCALDPVSPSSIEGGVKNLIGFVASNEDQTSDDYRWLYKAHFKVGIIGKSDVIVLFPQVISCGSGGKRFERKPQIRVRGNLSMKGAENLIRNIGDGIEDELKGLEKLRSHVRA